VGIDRQDKLHVLAEKKKAAAELLHQQDWYGASKHANDPSLLLAGTIDSLCLLGVVVDLHFYTSALYLQSNFPVLPHNE
jgi:hypothetical protein